VLPVDERAHPLEVVRCECGVSVDERQPLAVRRRRAAVPTLPDDGRPILPRDGRRPVRAAAVGDDDVVGPVGRLGVDARQRRVQVVRLVAGGHDDAHVVPIGTTIPKRVRAEPWDTMTDAQALFEELQDELQDTGRTLGDLLQEAIEDPAQTPDVVADLLEEAAETGQSVGELLQDAIQDSDEVFGEFTDGDLFVDVGDDDFRLDFDDDLLFVDPTSEEFEDMLRGLDVFGIGEELGFVPPAEDTDAEE
jgi:hypothetical protein